MRNKPERLPVFYTLRKMYGIFLSKMPTCFISYNVVATLNGLLCGFGTYVSAAFFQAVTDSVGAKANLSLLVWLAIAVGATRIGAQLLNGISFFMSNNFFLRMFKHLALLITEKASRLRPIDFENPDHLNAMNKAWEGADNSMGTLFIMSP